MEKWAARHITNNCIIYVLWNQLYNCSCDFQIAVCTWSISLFSYTASAQCISTYTK